MKHSLKKFLAGLLVVVMMITMLPANVLAGDTTTPPFPWGGTDPYPGGTGGEGDAPGYKVEIIDKGIQTKIIWEDGAWNGNDVSDSDPYIVTRPTTDKVPLSVSFKIEGMNEFVLLTDSNKSVLGLEELPDLSWGLREDRPMEYSRTIEVPTKISITTTLPGAADGSASGTVTNTEEKTVEYSFEVTLPEDSQYIIIRDNDADGFEWKAFSKRQYVNTATPQPITIDWIDCESKQPSVNVTGQVQRPKPSDVEIELWAYVTEKNNTEEIKITTENVADFGLTRMPAIVGSADTASQYAYSITENLPAKITTNSGVNEDGSIDSTTKTITYALKAVVPEGYVDTTAPATEETTEEQTAWEFTAVQIPEDPVDLGPFVVEWNDDSGDKTQDEINLVNRPTYDDIGQNLVVTFVKTTTDEEGNPVSSEPVVLNEDTYKQLGLTQMPVFQNDGTGVSQYAYSLNGLPSKLTETTTVEGENVTTTYQITYQVNMKQVPDGYLDTTKEADLPTETDPQQDKWNYTVQYDWSAQFAWLDNGNLYSSRPDSDITSLFNVYQVVSGEAFSKDHPVTTGVLTADQDGKITLSGVPGYTENGMPYQYFIEIKKTTEYGNNLVASNNAGVYIPQYQNVDNYSTNTEVLYENGTLNCLLNNSTNFVVTKKWEDGGRPATDRPSTVLHLYRVTEDSEGNVNIEKVKTASPVQNNDSVNVPKETDADGLTTVYFGTSVDDTPLPMYDNTGHRYVYFALETGLNGDYHSVINNTDSAYTEAVEALFNSIKADGLVKYVLNGGYIVNDQDAESAITATKKFDAQAMQSMTSTAVRFMLQYRQQNPDGTWTTWSDAGAEQLLDQTKVDEDGNVTLEISGFSQEAMGQAVQGPQVYKYDPNTGARIDYRWVEIAMSVNGGDWIDVTYTMDQSGKITYDQVNAGLVGPKANGQPTSAIFQPYYYVDEHGNVSKTEIVNQLVGEAEVVINKTWYGWLDDTHTVRGDLAANKRLETMQAKFYILQDGQYIDKETHAATSSTDNALVITLTMADLNVKGDAWTTTVTGLPRYDANGRSYVYSVEEIKVPGFREEVDYSNGVVTKNDATIPQTVADVSNTQGGNDDGLEFEVYKQWLDDGDLLSRKPVMVGLYRIADGIQGEPLLTATLTDRNQWNQRMYLPGARRQVIGTDDNGNPIKEGFDAFVILEMSVGGTPVIYDYDLDYSEIYTQATKTGYHNVTNAKDASDPYNVANRVGTIVPGDGSAEYYYDVFVQNIRGGALGSGRAYYMLTNQRTATLSMDLSKTWITGGIDITKINMDATFELLANGVRVDPREAGGTISATYVKFNDDKTFTLDVNEVADSARSENTATITIADLPKYDHTGAQIEYTLVETKIGDVDFVTRDGLRLAVVDGNTYVSSLVRDDEQTVITGAQNYHSGDHYYWVGRNFPQEYYNLSAKKVWRDDGPSNLIPRPDVAFRVYRVSSSMSVTVNGETMTLQQLAKSIVGEDGQVDQSKIDLLTEALESVKSSWGSPLDGDRFWNTKHNSWYWSCNMGSVSRYDGNGYPYIYFAQEIYTGQRGEYKTAYCNIPGADPVASIDAGATTKEVFGVPMDSLDVVTYESSATNVNANQLVILSDGVNYGKGDDDNCGNFYSRTTVNYREAYRTVSGRKLWKMPAGWLLPETERPELEVELWRINEPVTIDPSYKVSDLNALIDAYKDKDAAVQLNTMWLTGGVYTFHFTTDKDQQRLPMYDEYGRTYSYLVTEHMDLQEKPIHNYLPVESVVTTNNFYIQNTYTVNGAPNVEITVNKTWTGDHPEGDRAALFTLYAQQQNSAGQPIGNIVTMSKIVVGYSEDPANSGSYIGSGVFQFYTEGEKDAQGNYEKLPLYGPNNRELIYWVVESPINGYTIDTEKRYIELTPVESSMNAKGEYDLYTGESEYTNTYTGGEKTSISLEKHWDADNAMGIDYLPTEIRVKLMRSWGNTTVGTVTVAGGSEEVRTASMNSTNDWKISFTNLPKYGPNGMPYTYYLADGGDAESAIDQNNKTRLELFTNSRDGNNLKNTLQRTSLTAKKMWTITDGNGAATTPSWTVFNTLRDMGALPTTVTLYLQVKTADGDWKFVTNEATQSQAATNEANRLKYTIDVAALNSSTYNNRSYTFTNLPTNEVDTNNVYTYRIVEKLTWGSGDTATETWFYGNNDSNNQTLQAKGSQYAPETATITVNGTTQTITNNIPVISLIIDKAWDDNGNRDNTRPAKIDLTITTKDGKTFRASINAPSAGTAGNTWTGSKIILPEAAAKDNKSMAELLQALYTVTEATISVTVNGETYTYTRFVDVDTTNTEFNIFKGNSTTAASFIYHIKNTLDQKEVRKLTPISAEKIFVGDSLWNSVTRPTIRFSLQYKDPATNTFVTVTSANRANVFPSDNAAEGVQIVTAATDGKFTVNFGNLYKYWPRVTAAEQGIPALIEYRVIEEMLSGDTVISTTVYTAEPEPTMDNGSLKKTTWTNTLVTKELAVAKAWTTTDGNPSTALTASEVNDLINLGLLPEEIQITLTIKDKDGNVVAIPSGISATQTFSTLALAQNASVKWEQALPVYDKNGNVLTYELAETGIRFKGDTENTFRAVTSDGSQNVSVAAAQTIQGTESNFKVTFTNTLKTTRLTATKVWDDDNDRDGLRPSTLVITLTGKVDGTVVYTATATAKPDNQWKVTFIHLPVYDKDNQEIIYTVSEAVIAGYNVDTNGQPKADEPELKDGSYEFNNYHNPEKISITIKKVWDDDHNRDDKRTSVSFYLYAQPQGGTLAQVMDPEDPTKPMMLTLTTANALTDDTGAVTNADQWSDTIEGLPKYANGGKLITYTVKEVGAVEANGAITIQLNKDDPESVYSVSYVQPTYSKDASAYTHEVTNTHEEVKTSVVATKVWNDNQDQDGMRRPVTFQLYADGVKATHVVNGQTVDYTLELTSQNAVANDTDTWSVTFTDLPKYRTVTTNGTVQNGVEVIYTVKEVGAETHMVNGVELTTIQLVENEVDSVYTVTYSNDHLTVTNTHVPVDVNVSVEKIWADQGDQDGKRAEAIRFVLRHKTTSTGSFEPMVYAEGEQKGEVIVYTLNADNALVENGIKDNNTWTMTINGLPKYADGYQIQYDVVEVLVSADGTITYLIPEDNADNVAHFQTIPGNAETWYKVSYGDVAVAENGDASATITNTHENVQIEVSVAKTWADANNQDGMRAPVTFALYAGGNLVTYTVENNGETLVLPVTVTLSAQDGQSDKFINPARDQKNAYKFDKYTAGGATIQYTVKEVSLNADGTIAAVREADVPFQMTDSTESLYTATYESSKDDDGNVSHVVTNTHAPVKIQISVSKTWDDANNQDGMRPESIQVGLFRKTAADQEYTLVEGTVFALSSDNTDADGNETPWSHVYSGFDKYTNGGVVYEYAVFEVQQVNGAYQKIEGGFYSDVNDPQGGFKESEYSITYKTPTVDTTGNVTCEITNSHDPIQVEVSVMKIWQDNDNQDGMRTPVTFALYADNTLVTYKAEKDGEEVTVPVTITLTEEDIFIIEPKSLSNDEQNVPKTMWFGKFINPAADEEHPNDFDKYNQGTVISYTVKEVVIGEDGTVTPVGDTYLTTGNVDSAYQVTYDPIVEQFSTLYQVTNAHTPETIDLTVLKIWDDAQDQDAKRAEEITFVVRQKISSRSMFVPMTDENGDPILYTLKNENAVLDEEGNATDTWTRTITGLPKYIAGYQIEYDVQEVIFDNDGLIVYLNKDYGTEKFMISDLDPESWYEVSYGEVQVKETEDETDGDTTATITNSHEPIEIEVEIAKAWDDADNQDGKRTAVSFQLFAQIEENGDTAPVMKDGEPVILTLTEEDLFTPPEIMPFDLEDQEEDNHQDNNTDDNLNDPEDNLDDIIDIEPVITIWTGKIQGLMKYNKGFAIVYTLKELDANKNPIEIDVDEEGNPINNSFLTDPDDVDSEYTVEELRSTYMNGDVYYEFTNTHKPVLVDVKVTKVWDDADDQDGKRPEEITVALYRQTEKDGEFEMVKDSVVTMMASEEDEEDYIWTHTYEDLDKYCRGYQIVYTVKEVLVDEDEKVTILDGEKNILMTIDGDDESDYTVTYKENLDESGNLSVEITNTHETEEVKLVITKVWDDENDHDGARPESITVRLYATWADKTLHIDIPMDAKTLDEKGNWVVELIIDKYMDGEIITYTVVELNEKGEEVEKTISFDIFEYTVKVEDMTITNSYVPAVTAVTVTKVWDDGGNWYLKRADEITVILYADGTEVARKTLTKENALVKDGKTDTDTWVWTFEGLDQYKDGKEIVYSVKEADEANGVIVMKANTEYKVVYSGNQKDGFKITNTYEFGRLGVPEGWIYDEVQGVWKPKQDPVKPNTGDNSRPDLWMAMMLVSFAGMLIVSRTKRKEEEE